MAEPSFTFEAAHLPDGAIIQLYGTFDLAAMDVFDEQILPLFDGTSSVCIDLGGLTSFDPAGLHRLLDARDKLMDLGGSLRLVGGDGLLEDWVKVADLFEIEEPSTQAPQVARKGQGSEARLPARVIRRLVYRRSRG